METNAARLANVVEFFDHRRVRAAPTLACCLALTALACTDDGSGDADTGGTESDATSDADTEESGETDDTDGTGDTDDTGPVDPKCEALAPGLNTGFDVNGTARSFYLDLPAGADAGGPWPVVFAYHGLGDTAANFRNLFAGQVDNADMPFILVTPEDTDFPLMVPLIGTIAFDWDTFAVSEGGAGNLEVEMFDAVRECVDQRWGVDDNHVHAAGFSLGGVTTDMLATTRGELLASVATYSGGYWNNPPNVGLSLGTVASWPAHAVENPYPQMIIHGGPEDTFVVLENVFTMSFYEFAQNDMVWLPENGHPVIVCDHGSAHTAPSSVSPASIVQFFAAHPLGVGDSPWKGSPPANGFGDCTFDGL